MTGFVLAQGTHQTGCTIADIQGVEYSTVRGLLTSPLARAALVADRSLNWQLVQAASAQLRRQHPLTVVCSHGQGDSRFPSCRVAALAERPGRALPDRP